MQCCTSESMLNSNQGGAGPMPRKKHLQSSFTISDSKASQIHQDNQSCIFGCSTGSHFNEITCNGCSTNHANGMGPCSGTECNTMGLGIDLIDEVSTRGIRLDNRQR